MVSEQLKWRSDGMHPRVISAQWCTCMARFYFVACVSCFGLCTVNENLVFGGRYSSNVSEVQHAISCFLGPYASKKHSGAVLIIFSMLFHGLGSLLEHFQTFLKQSETLETLGDAWRNSPSRWRNLPSAWRNLSSRLEK